MYPKDYVKEVSKFCKKNNILFTIDEMQSGFGRTGKKFCYEHYEVNPDIICCGKGMGSGFPISGLLAKNKAFKNILPGSMSSTHSGNPMACAAGIATIDEINRLKLVKKSFQNGKYFHELLNKLMEEYPEFIKEINGKGLIAAIIFYKNKKIDGVKLANYMSEHLLKQNLIVVKTGRESIKLGPPLIITRSQIKNGVNQIRKSLDISIKKNKF